MSLNLLPYIHLIILISTHRNIIIFISFSFHWPRFIPMQNTDAQAQQTSQKPLKETSLAVRKVPFHSI